MFDRDIDDDDDDDDADDDNDGGTPLQKHIQRYTCVYLVV